ncbi:MAG TPA: right-handed parallel beta-helix repeat-containing protein [Stellaceae bacterium]|jgi:hypothetical protein|nr:right-handed parallel beta-helix repeat-containing protein [Stellaceae bacterium]
MYQLVRAATTIAAILLALPSTIANATGARVFVSGAGTDTGNCARTAPCRSFGYAITQAGAGGEIVVLDSAGYGTLTIAQSLTITNPGGVEAGVSTSGATAAITIGGSVPTAVVLRGLTIEGNGVGTNGILVNPTLSGDVTATVAIIDCVIKDFTQDGIHIAPTGNVGPLDYVLIDHTRAINNGGNGIQIVGTLGASIPVSINETTADYNGTGITFADIAIQNLIVGSHADYNQSAGIIVGSSSAATLKSSTAIGNTITGSDDLSNANQVDLFNNNTIGQFDNNGSVLTDGTNNIRVLTGNALTKLAPQ